MPDDSKPIQLSRADTLVMKGLELHRQAVVDGAQMHYSAALMLEPEHPVALWNLAAALVEQDKYASAYSIAKRAVKAAPNNHMARCNLAAALAGLRRYKDAIKELEVLTRLMPREFGVWHNYALALRKSGEIDKACKAFEHAVKLGNSPSVRSDRALTILSNGELNRGLEAYGMRFEMLKKHKAWDLGVPEWTGQNLEGLSILVHHEQGLGDSIMLARFLPLLVKRGAKVTLAVPGSLVRLFEHSLQGIEVLDQEDDLSHLDLHYHVPTLSVPHRLGLEPKHISPKPYLTAKPVKADKFHWPFKARKVGICWASGDHGKALATLRRVVPLELLFPLIERDDISLVSLQKDQAQRDIVSLGAESFIFDPMGLVHDFMDTAGAIAELDLVLSVDSSVAHLAGALGKPTIMLSPFVRCWRWWGGASGLPWYENFQIFYQDRDGSWERAVAKAIEAAVVAKGV